MSLFPKKKWSIPLKCYKNALKIQNTVDNSNFFMKTIMLEIADSASQQVLAYLF